MSNAAGWLALRLSPLSHAALASLTSLVRQVSELSEWVGQWMVAGTDLRMGRWVGWVGGFLARPGGFTADSLRTPRLGALEVGSWR